MHIKEPLLLIGKSSPYIGGSGFPLSLSEWSFTICLTPYNHIYVRTYVLYICIACIVCMYVRMYVCICVYLKWQSGARCRSVVRAFAHGAMGRRIDPSWSEPIELFLVPASAPRLV